MWIEDVHKFMNAIFVYPNLSVAHYRAKHEQTCWCLQLSGYGLIAGQISLSPLYKKNEKKMQW